MDEHAKQAQHLSTVSGEDVKKADNSNDEPSMDLFSTRTPKDWKAGMSSGTKNIAKGVFSGVAAVVAAPVMSTYDAVSKGEQDLGSKTLNGLVGFGKGLFFGIMAGVALPVAGITTGILQIGRGVLNTPDAVQQQHVGKDWDPKRRVWYLYDLQAEAEKVLKETEEEYAHRIMLEQRGEAGASTFASKQAEQQQQQKSEEALRPERAVKDRTYYDVLEVSTSATGSEIKKAYFKKARQLHPDKNLDDPLAKEKFQQVGTAYQILSNDELRQKYDVNGLSGVTDAPVMDSSAFFAVIFGSDKFESIVGQLRLAMMMELGENPLQQTEMTTEEEAAKASSSEVSFKIEFRQGKREVQLAVNLAKKLDDGLARDLAQLREEFASLERNKSSSPAQQQQQPTYTKEEEQFVPKVLDANTLKEREAALIESFKRHIEEEALDLSKTPIGAALLGVVSYVYEEQAAKQLGFKHSMSAGLGFSGQTTHVMGTQFQVVKSVYSAYTASKKMAPKEGETEPSMEQAAEGMGSIIDTLWHISVVDIEGTLRKSCRKLFKDSGISLLQREARAEAMLIVSQVFKEKSQSSELGLKALKSDLKKEMQSAEEAAKFKRAQDAELEEKVKREAEEALLAQRVFSGMFTGDELREMKPKQLKEICTARSLSTVGCTEKEDFVKLILRHQEAHEVL